TLTDIITGLLQKSMRVSRRVIKNQLEAFVHKNSPSHIRFCTHSFTRPRRRRPQRLPRSIDRKIANVLRSWRIGVLTAASLISSPSLAQFSVSQFNPSPCSISARPLMTGDFNGDGKLDVIHVGDNPHHAHVWLSQGNGKFDV